MDKGILGEAPQLPLATTVVIFGATGDLSQKKLLPSLFRLYQDGFLPQKFAIVGCSRTPHTDESFRRIVENNLKDINKNINTSWLEKFLTYLYFCPVNIVEKESFQGLANKLEELNNKYKVDFARIFYLATAPRFFSKAAEHLSACVSSREANDILVVEKPFGNDVYSARELNKELLHYFDEDQIFRIDHYLGKETVQNILMLRFANSIFEPLWNHHFIKCIQITVAESVGVGGRGSYFDKAGIVRDMVQNHILQMLSLVCMEPPVRLSSPNSIRDEKVKVLRSLRRLDEKYIIENSVRGQYTEGFILGEKVCGYREEKGVAKDSITETFAALKVEIDNWRWAGVPILIRVGKRLPKKITEISLHFKEIPKSLFKAQEFANISENILAISVQPNEGINLQLNSKAPGVEVKMRSIIMDFSYGASFGLRLPDAYERLLLDAMRRDPTLFTRSDEIEEAWEFLQPLLELWSTEEKAPLYYYSAGSWGPPEASEIARKAGQAWRKL
ncbi:MAG: glucose-6-phosphate dehydrogenase [Candidatus Dadabacteria bacterium]|nr:MAG: glucose-6-phosphate dehydrogenase [Candidatus Dadabacteria bacterium]